jgi:hypothetical protein
MNSEYVWWLGALLATGTGAVLFLALGRVPEIEDEPDEVTPRRREAALPESAPVQRPPVSITVPGADDPSVTSEIP